MRALRGKAAGLVVALVGALVAPVQLSAAPATAAAATSRPSAIALGPDGTSYVGYADGNGLTRLTKAGRRLTPLPLDMPGPVNGLAFAGGRVWVAYDGSVSALDPRGDVVAHFDRSPGATCAHDAQHHVTRYGGIAVDADRVYVTDRCTAALEVYDRESGALDVRVPLAGRGHGLAWLRSLDGKAPRLFVALPDQRSVHTYALGVLTARSQPVHRLEVKKPYRGRRPVPTGVTVDRLGALTVADAANHAIYLYNARQGYGLYRTLGHPSKAGSGGGYLDSPAALAQQPQDGGGMAGNLFIADTRNGRVQRWDSGGGYTYWAKPAPVPTVGDPGDPDDPDGPDDPDPDGAPVNTVAPSISAPSGSGSLLCNAGTWSGGAASYSYRWLRDGVLLASPTGSIYRLTAGDNGTEIACRVTASGTGGSATATSSPWFVGAASKPLSTAAPSIIGTPARGRTLTCATGSWSATPAPRFTYVWLRGSVQVGSAPTHVVAAGDVGAPLSCTVIATNQAGSSSASSAAVVPGGGGSPGPGSGPTNDPCAGEPRVLIAAGAARVRSPRVQLTVVAPFDTTEVEVANTPDFADSRTVAADSCSVSWLLDAPASDDVPTEVYARWVDGDLAGEVVADSVRFDRSGPRVAAARVRFTRHRWRLRITARDASDLRTIVYGPARTGIRRTVDYASQVRVRVPEMARWVRLVDQLGNVGPWRRVR